MVICFHEEFDIGVRQRERAQKTRALNEQLIWYFESEFVNWMRVP